ncbi:MAG: bifunctional glutamate N-acetyltransferase/amino-acid acetyltransferase ArgJ [Defluviitaleaceae bacterium]|nr:bifunctional glutamate N-acetyltransferase/amino-acid acetyltransferase ArgJ [Defluviitaleaceae bacterium]
MTDIKFIPDGGVTSTPGFLASGVHCGIRKNKTKRDLALILADKLCNAAAVYTTNKVKAAPVYLTMENLQNGKARAIIANSGNANACAPGGEEAAKQMTTSLATHLKINPTDVIVNSTGVIGVPLPIDAITTAIPALAQGLTQDNAPVTEAIMTTDTFPKSCAAQVNIDGKTVTVGGIAKGSGMIHPNMATMFAFITTDCNICGKMLQQAIKASADATYNCISVDGDTSTNDMTAILASGKAGNSEITTDGAEYQAFLAALNAVNLHLAKEIARDGEGATKLIVCKVSGAKDYNNAIILAKGVISSSLVKAAMFGEDANFGRVLCALGYSGGEFDPATVDFSYVSENGRLPMCKQSRGLAFDEDIAKKVLGHKEITIEIELNNGIHSATAYG